VSFATKVNYAGSNPYNISIGDLDGDGKPDLAVVNENFNNTVSVFRNTMPIRSDGLVAWYKFDGNTADSSGNGNNGTNNGATLTTDRFGNANRAYSFNGSTQYIDVGTMSFNLPLTASVWMKSSVVNTVDYTSLIGWNNTSSPYNGIELMTRGDG
jgi:hypothetical protein